MPSPSESNVKQTPRMVLNVPKPSDEESNKEAKHPHDDDQKVAALDSKVEAMVVGSHKKQRRQYTENNLSDEESNKEAKHPHGDDQKLAALDSKVEAMVVGSHKKQRRQYTKNDRVKLVALIGEALKKLMETTKY